MQPKPKTRLRDTPRTPPKSEPRREPPRTPIGDGTRSGQPPYRPFENDRLPWAKPTSERAGPVLAKRTGDLELRRPALLVLIGSGDAGNCCAANYERTVFRDQRVVALSRRFVCVRAERTSVDKALLARAEVKAGKPALVVLDAEGLCFARWQECADPKDVAWAMQQTLRLSRRKARVAPRMAKRLAEIEQAVTDGQVREAGKLLRRFDRLKGGPVAGYARAEALLKAWELEARARIADAQGDPDVASRWSRLRGLRGDYDLVPELVRPIRKLLKELEDGERTGPIVREHVANGLIDEALARIAKGDAVGGRNQLRKVGRDYPDGAAAERAQRELERHMP